MNDQTYMRLGVNPAGTTFVAQPAVLGVERSIPRFAPEYYLSQWNALPYGEAQMTVGEFTLRVLAVRNADAFSSFGALLPPKVDVPRTVAEQVADNALPLSEFDYLGKMREPHLAMAVAPGHITFQVYRGGVAHHTLAPVPLDWLVKLGHRAAWRILGEIALGALARLHPDVFRAFPALALSVSLDAIETARSYVDMIVEPK